MVTRWTGLDWIALDWIALDWTGLSEGTNTPGDLGPVQTPNFS